MADPKVGMKFGSYYVNIQNDIKNGAQIKYIGQSEAGGKVKYVFNNINLADNAGTKYNGVIGSNVYNDNHGYASYTVTNPSGLYSGFLKYEGATRNYDGNDITFTRINGDTSYAIDINHNGIVDDGEIFEGKSKPFTYNDDGSNDEIYY